MWAGRDKLAALNRERSLPVAKKVVMLPWKVVNKRLGPERKGTAYLSGLHTERKCREPIVTGESPINMSTSTHTS